MDRPIGTHSRLLRLAVVFEGGLGLVALGLGWLVGRSPLAEIDWNLPAVAIGCGASVPMFAAVAIVLRSRWAWCIRLRRLVDGLIVPLFKGCGAGELAVISLVAGFAEELLFRGVIQAALGEWISPVVGLVGASLLFGLAHPLTRAYAAIVTLAGLYLGGLWLWSGNLLVPIVTHAVYDFAVLLYLVRRGRPASRAQSV
jgi:CAAX protease family protein